MLKLPIEYTDFNGTTITEIFYFNLSLSEVTEMELSMAGGLSENLTRIGESGNPKLIMDTFKDIVLKSYGVRSDDGRRFVKSPEILAEFLSTGAYDVLYFKLITDSTYTAAFVNGIMPSPEDMNVAQYATPDNKDEPRAIPQSVQQAAAEAEHAKVGGPITVENIWASYNYFHVRLMDLGVEHAMLDHDTFVSLTAEQRTDMVRNLELKVGASLDRPRGSVEEGN